MKLLEMDIIKRIQEISGEKNFQMNLSVIELNQFYGIEIDDFACEIAKLSLWLAEHQMNCKFREEIGEPKPTLPLGESGHIVCGNALRMDWEEVCPKYIEKTTLAHEVNRADLRNTPLKLDLPKEEAEVYVLGNPITKAQFADILQNPFYYGVMYYNKSYFPHIYEKLISKELFDKCTEVRTGKFKRTSKHTKEPYIFRGLVRCKHCGCLLSPYTKKGQYVYLRHTALKDCEHCNNVSEKILLKEVEKALASISFDDELKLTLADALKKRYEATHGNNHYQLEKNRNQLADVEENQKKLLDLLIAGTVSAEVYRSKNAEYETVKIELQAKIEQLQTPDNSVERAIDKVLNFSQNSFAIFKSSQIEEKRRILNIVFANFLMDGKNPEISMHKNFKLLSKIGACEDWCPGEDSNFHYLR